MNVLFWILFIVCGYLMGSVMFCKIVPKLWKNKDICDISDDGNPGAFNVFKYCGKKLGMICLSTDMLKGFIPVFLASMFLKTNSLPFALIMAAPVIGHAVGAFNHFHGGKCIATSFGVMFGILPVSWIGIVTLAAIWIVTAAAFKVFSVVTRVEANRSRSVAVYVLFGVITNIVFNILGLVPLAIGCLLIAGIAVIKQFEIINGFCVNKTFTKELQTSYEELAKHKH